MECTIRMSIPTPHDDWTKILIMQIAMLQCCNAAMLQWKWRLKWRNQAIVYYQIIKDKI